MTTGTNPDVDAKITPEDIEKMRMLIGQPEPNWEPAWNEVAHVSDFQRFLNAYGDNNPIFWDKAYAKTTRWRDVIAPPMFMMTMGIEESGTLPKEIREKSRGALRGIGMYQSGFEFEFYRPVFHDDVLYRRAFISDVIEKTSDFAGKSVLVKHQTSYANNRGEDVGVYRYLMIHAERRTAAEKGKYKTIEKARYTPEMIKEIDEAYEKEHTQGSKPRFWEDVKEGEELPVMVKGPLSLLEIIYWHIAIGMGGFGILPLRLNYLNRKRLPRFYTPDEYGVPAPVQRMHWEESWAKKVGAPLSYDYGMMRAAWTVHYLTNWMGDDGWLWKMDCEMRKFNFQGDTQWFTGHVSKKYIDGDKYCVDIETSGKSQRDEITTPGRATVILPSRAKGAAVLPLPPQSDQAKKIIEGKRL